MSAVIATGPTVMRGIYIRCLVLAVWAVLLMIAMTLVHAHPLPELAAGPAVGVSYLHR